MLNESQSARSHIHGTQLHGAAALGINGLLLLTLLMGW